jgi:hypothetical protein
VRRCLGWGSVGSALLVIVLFVISAVEQSTVIGGVCGLSLIIFIAFFWPWALLQNNANQLADLASAPSISSASNDHGEMFIDVGAPITARALIRGHLVAAAVLVTLGLLGLLLVGAAATGLIRGRLSFDVGTGVGVLLILVAVSWGGMFRYLYVRPRDAKAIVGSRADVQVWGLIITAGLRGVLEASTTSRGHPDLEKNGYIAVTPEGIEIWQRTATQLTRLFLVPRTEVTRLEQGVVSDNFQPQQCVNALLRSSSGEEQTVAILIKGISGGMSAWSKAPSLFIRAWAGTS